MPGMAFLPSEVRAGALSTSLKWSHSQGHSSKLRLGKWQSDGLGGLIAAQGSARPLQCQLSSPSSSLWLTVTCVLAGGKTEA